MDIFKRFETIRHGDKEGEELSEIGIENTKIKAVEVLSEIEQSPLGAVFYILPSQVGRAADTRNVLESELINLVQEREIKDIEFISVNDKESIEKASGDMNKKYIISDLQPSSLLGFNEKTPSEPAFSKFKNMYKGDEDLAGKTWIAKPEELAMFKERMKEKFSDLNTDEIDPAQFKETPEEVAIKYIRLMKRVAEITEKFFPGHPFNGLLVGHNINADFTVMALSDTDMSIESVEKLGGKFRNFLESSYFEMRDKKIYAKYRQQETEQEKNLDDVIEKLKELSKVRKQGWNN